MTALMGTLSTGMILVFVIASAATVFAMMRVFTNIIEHETELHDLRNRIKQLQFEQQLYLARLHGQISEEADVEIIEDDGPIEAIEHAQLAASAVADAIELDAEPQAA